MTEATTAARLEARGLVRRFRGDAGIRGIDLDVAAGEIHALAGLNGAGKTTLLRSVLGMLRLDAGRVRLLGHDMELAPPEAWSAVGHLVEQPFAYRELDVATSLAAVARLRGVPRGDVREVVERGIAALGLQGLERRRVGELSLGNRQRLGLAAALQHRPRLVVLDEPSNALDPAGVLLLRAELLALAADGAGVLVSSHHLDEVARVADRITVVNAGRVVGALDPAGADLERAFFARVHADDLERSGT
ncbi:ABC transporter ATP-binding protein [Agromyces sp. C10]|uniref:ABC transporter ATP-binding protein n=1 Tax=Agromyces sp. C10 TaxID=2935077 RepID=UPI00200B1113|nr:ABC transporter ATP-binding protein [Agromyces sp. C10]MCK8610665.1 ABC transporter ATP-binding protein [Agromyces sp. C10]